MGRKGVIFECGWPNFDFGQIHYAWPNEFEEMNKKFSNNLLGLVGIIGENFKRYSAEFGLRSVSSDPAIIQGKGIIASWHDNGRDIEFYGMCGANFVNGYNLDSWVDNVVAFNLGSDVLEFLSPEVLAARVSYDNENWQIKYALPEGSALKDSVKASKKWIDKVYSVAKIGGSPDVKIEGDSLVLENDNGRIIVDDEYLRTEGFSKEYVPGSSFAASKLMNLTKSDS